MKHRENYQIEPAKVFDSDTRLDDWALVVMAALTALALVFGG